MDTAKRLYEFVRELIHVWIRLAVCAEHVIGGAVAALGGVPQIQRLGQIVTGTGFVLPRRVPIPGGDIPVPVQP